MNDPLHSPAPDESAEATERHAARNRARGMVAKAQLPGESSGEGPIGQRAFAALADNVRDYMVFLLDTAGTICYWGTGATLMTWWKKEEAEGSHLRLLFPDDGSEDGTAEAQLAEALRIGEYSSEGRRVRSDGSMFWAGVTLTALRDAAGGIFGFVNVTKDLTARRAAEAALALTWSAQQARDSAMREAATEREARERADDRTVFALEQVRSYREYASRVLETELVAVAAERVSLLAEMAAVPRE